MNDFFSFQYIIVKSNPRHILLAKIDTILAFATHSKRNMIKKLLPLYIYIYIYIVLTMSKF